MSTPFRTTSAYCSSICNQPIRRVNRELTFNSEVHLFMPQLMAAVRTWDLGDPPGNIADQHDRIVGALDVPFVGV